MQGTAQIAAETRQNELKPGSVLLLKQVLSSFHGKALVVSLALPGPRQRVAALVLDPDLLEPSKGLTSILQGVGGVGVAQKGQGGKWFYSWHQG